MTTYRGRIVDLRTDVTAVVGISSGCAGAYYAGYALACQDAAAIAAEADAEIARLRAEVAALRGAMPDAALLTFAANEMGVEDYRTAWDQLHTAAAAIRALDAAPVAGERGA